MRGPMSRYHGRFFCVVARRVSICASWRASWSRRRSRDPPAGGATSPAVTSSSVLISAQARWVMAASIGRPGTPPPAPDRPRRFFRIPALGAIPHGPRVPPMRPVRCARLLGAALGLAGCRALLPAGDLPVTPVVVPEAFVTPRDEADNLDSPAVWHGADDRHWLVVTAKDTDRLLVFDAATGVPVRTVEGAFERPNGIAVADDLAFVVERDGARVRALRLPDFAPLGVFGEEHLERPYGVAVVPQGEGRYRLFVTDSQGGPLGLLPLPGYVLARRVHRFAVTAAAGALDARHEGAFGETDGPGVVRVAESVLADPAHGRLFVAEEAVGRSTVHVYGLDGRYAG